MNSCVQRHARKAAVLSFWSTGVLERKWLCVPICNTVPSGAFILWVYFNYLALTVGYLGSYRTTEVISDYAIWCMHNYEIIVCNLFRDGPMIKSTAAALFFFSSFFNFKGWVGGSTKQMGGCVCLARVHVTSVPGRQKPERVAPGQTARVAHRDGALLSGHGCAGLQDVCEQCATSPCMGTLRSRTRVSLRPPSPSAAASLVPAAPAPGTDAHPSQPWTALQTALLSHAIREFIYLRNIPGKYYTGTFYTFAACGSRAVLHAACFCPTKIR